MSDNTPLYSSRITNTYLEYLAEHYPALDSEKILAKAGIERYEVDDPAHYLTQRQVDRFHALLVAETGNPNVAREAGRFTIFSKKIGAIKTYTLGLMSPATVYLMAGKLYDVMSRAADIKTRKISNGKVLLRARPKPGVNEKPYQCENRKGTLESLARLFTRDFATVEHPVCYHKGGEACEYIITWKMTQAMLWKRISSYLFLLTVPGGAAALFLLPLHQAMVSVTCAAFVSVGALCMSLFMDNRELVKTIERQGNSARELLTERTDWYNETILIQEIGCASAMILDVQQYLNAVMRIMKERLEFDRGLVMLEKDRPRRLEYVTSFGLSDDQRRTLEKTIFNLDNPDSEGPFVRAFMDQTPFLVNDVGKIISSLSEKSRNFAQVIAAESFICVPVVFQKKAFGVLALDKQFSQKPLTKSDLGILKGIAAQIAAGLANAHFLDQLRLGEEKFKKLYEESKRGEALYRSLIQSSADPIAMCGLDLVLQYISPEYENVFGWKQDELAGQALRFEPVMENEATLMMIREVARSGKPQRGFETRCYTKNGQLLNVLISVSRYVDHKENPAGLLLIIRDVSANKQLEAQLQQAQKMEAIGTLAGGIAHDFNNLLSVVQGNLSLLMLDYEPGHTHLERLQNIEKQVQSGAKLTGQLLGYARKGNYEIKPFNLVQLVHESCEAFGRTRKQITINHQFPPEPVIVEADWGQIEQVLFNIYVNASDAMPGGGRLDIHVSVVDSSAIQSHRYQPEPGRYVRLALSDSGVGMRPEIKARMFDPFFTTKKMEKGTGLGLASVYGIVKSHKGYIEVTSAEGKGTTMIIFLPYSGKVPPAGAAAQKDTLYNGRETILFVDDEPMILEVSHEMLTRMGYTVLQADDGQSAVEIYRRHRDTIDLVIFDLVMPGLSGGELYSRLKRLNPDVKAILSSGYSMDGQAKGILDSGCNEFIQKPFNMQQLSKKINQTLRPDDPDG